MLGWLTKGYNIIKAGGVASLSLLGIGVAGAAVDGAVTGGKYTGKVIEGVGGLAGRGMQEAVQTQAAAKRDAEVANSSSGFQGIFMWLSNFFNIIGLESLADSCENMAMKIEKRAFEADQRRKAQRDALEHGTPEQQNTAAAPEAVYNPNTGEVTTQPAEKGEVSVGSAFGAAAYGLENGVVSMATGITSLVSGTYEALTTDKGWGASIADDFNSQKGWAMGHLDSLHGKPEIDTPLEKGLYYGGEFGSWLVPVAATAKVVSQVPNALKTFVPSLGMK